MQNNSFNSSISAKISADEAIQKIGKVPDWWGVTFTGNAEKQGDTFTVRMTQDSFFNFSVTELIPGKRVVWLVFDLKESDGTTELMFTHEGLTPDAECYKDCE